MSIKITSIYNSYQLVCENVLFFKNKKPCLGKFYVQKHFCRVSFILQYRVFISLQIVEKVFNPMERRFFFYS